MSNSELHLVQEDSLPPDFNHSDPLAVWNAENDRDLIAEIRGVIRDLRRYGLDLLAEDDDYEFMEDLCIVTGTYGWICSSVLLPAIREIRKMDSNS